MPATYNRLPVTRINAYALYGNTLTTAVEIGDGIDKIAARAFSNSSALRIVTVPSSVNIVNQYGFYSLSNCRIYIEHESIPEDWDSSWYYSIGGHVLNATADYDKNGEYLFETVDGKVYLVKYLKPMVGQTPIMIPEKVNGKAVYGIRGYCFDNSTGSSSDRYVFVVPDSITVMESYAIHLYYSYSTLYMAFASASDIPSTWSSSWIYRSSYATKYYADSWELVDGVPTLKS